MKLMLAAGETPSVAKRSKKIPRRLPAMLRIAMRAGKPVEIHFIISSIHREAFFSLRNIKKAPTDVGA
jgi:hypothetical protein